MRVGIAAGLSVGLACGIGANDGTSQKQIIVLAGQSNAVGKANSSTVTDVSLLTSFPSIQLMQKVVVGTTTDPITWGLISGPADLDKRAGTTDNFGPDVSMGRALHAAASGRFAIAKFALTGTSLATQWLPGIGWPTSPGADPDLFDQFLQFMESAETSLEGRVAAIIWVQGENDGLVLADSLAYEQNLTTFFNAVRAVYPGVPVIISRQNNSATVAYKATIREAQANWVAANPNTAYLVDTDDLALIDAYHFGGDAQDTLGRRFADRALALLNVVNRNPVAAYTVDVVGKVATFTDTTTDPGDTIATWAWNFGDGSGTSALKNPTYTYATAGSFTVGLTVTDSRGGTSVTSQTVVTTNNGWSADFTSGKGVPGTTAQWEAVISAAGLTGVVAVPDYWLKAQETGAIGARDLADSSGSGYTFAAGGSSLLYQQTVSGWTRKFVGTSDNTSHRWQCTDARLPDALTGDVTFVSYSLIANTTSNVARAVSQIGTGPTAYIGGAANTRVQSGANGAATATTDYGSVRPYALRNGRTVSTTVGTADAAIKVTPTFSGLVTGKGITLGQVAGATACSTAHTGYAFGWSSHISDANLKLILQTLGWTVTW